jgi:hypothetical protein
MFTNTKLLHWSALLLVAVAFALFFATDVALAQESKAKSVDKTIATKKGVSGSLGNKEFDQKKLPGTKEYALVAASFIVMIAVVKWL